MITTRRLATLACATLLLGCESEPTSELTAPEPSLSAAGNQSVTGHVNIPPQNLFGIIERYSFNAVRRPGGGVSGEWQLTDKFFPGKNGLERVHGNVTCFSIQPDGKTAFLGGVVENESLFGIPAGAEAVWTIVDNGEGSGSPADMATDLTFGFPVGSGVAAFHCATGLGFTNIPPTPIASGNVQARQ